MTKNELKNILHLDTLINSNLKQLEELRSFKSVLPSLEVGDKVQSNKISDTTFDYVANIVNLENIINNDIDKLVELKLKAKREFKRLDIVYRTLMELRYLECKDWEEISAEMAYSTQHIYRLHGEALERIK